MRTYIARDWFWFVGADTTQVYSSAAFAFLPVAHASYVAFLAGGNIATNIPTQADLREVLNRRGVQFLAEGVPAVLDDQPRIARARVRLVAASFAITSGVPRSIPWSAAKTDPLVMWSAPVANPERIEIKQPGVYQFTIGVRFTEGTRAGTRSLMMGLGLGGSPTDLGTVTHAPALAGNTSFNFTEYTDDPLALGSFLRGFVEQGSGGSINAVARVTIVRCE